MSDETISSSTPADVIQPLPPKPVRSSNLFTEVDDAVEEALSKGGKEKPRAKAPAERRGPPTRSERRAAEAEVDELLNDDSIGFRAGREPEPDEDDEEDEEPTKPQRRAKPQPEEDVEDEPQPAARETEEEDEDAEPEVDPDEGTKKKPYRREDLPDDRFVEVKVNGEKHVVPLRELADSYSGQKNIQLQLNKIGEERATMQRRIQEAGEEVKKNGRYFESLISDPDKLYDMLTSNDRLEAEVLQRIFERRYEDLSAWEKNPAARARFLYERGQKTIQRREAQLQAQQQRTAHEQEQQRIEQHRMSVLKPGWEEGLRRAGLLNNKSLPPELMKTAQLHLNMRADELGGHPVTTEDVAAAVAYSAKFHGLRPDGTPPTRKNIIPPRSGQQAPARSGSRKWDGVPRSKRSMDPDFLMRGVRVRG